MVKELKNAGKGIRGTLRRAVVYRLLVVMHERCIWETK